MNLGQRASMVLGVQPGEARLVWRLLALYLVLIGALVLIQSMAFGLFIAEYGSSRLPLAYLAIAGLATLVSFGYLRLGSRVSFERLLTLNLAFLAVGCLVLWLGLRSPVAGAATFLLPVWFQIFVTLANLAVWPLAMRLFDVRQSKRLFGLIGAGNWIANMLGGLFVAPLVALVGPANLLALAAVVVVGGWLLLRGIVRDHLPSIPVDGAPGRVGAGPRAKGHLGAYAWRIFAYTAAWWLAFYFVDNVFYAQAGAQYATAESLTAFIGRFLSVTGAVALFTTVVLTSRVLRRFGLGAGLLTLPVLIAISVAALALGGTLGVPAVVLFWLASAAKLSNVAFGFSLSQTSHNVMYQALEGSARERVQTIAEGIVQPVAIGVAGGSLLLLTAVFGLDGVGLAWVLTPLAVLWIVLTLRVSAAYPGTLAVALRRRRWGEGVAAPLDAAALSLLRTSLQDDRPGPVLFALERLEPDDRSLTGQAWQRILKHPVAGVRAAAVAKLAAAGPKATDLLEPLLHSEPETPIRADVIRALAGKGSARAVEEAMRSLDTPYPDVRAAALAIVLRHGGVSQVADGVAALERLTRSAAIDDRVLAGRVIDEVGLLGRDMERWKEALLRLLADDNSEVRRAALRAAGGLRNPELWPAVVGAAALPGSSRHAERALAAGGREALIAVAPLVDRGGLPAASLVAIARAVARLDRPAGEAVAGLLARLRNAPSAAVRHAALEALAANMARAKVPGPRSAVGSVTASPAAVRTSREAWVQDELESAGRHGAWIADLVAQLPEAPGAALLTAALQDAWRRERDIVLLLAAIATSSPASVAAVLDARTALARADAGATARALEVVEVNLPAGLRAAVLPWLEALAPEPGHGTAAHRPGHGTAAPEPGHDAADGRALAGRLEELITGERGQYLGPWVRACALHLVGSMRWQLSTPALASAERDQAELVVETARWAVRRIAVPPEEVEESMLSSLERAMILKGVRFFSGAPHEVLVDLAALLDEIEVQAGDDVVRQGDDGDSLFVVVAGSVSVHDGDSEIEVLGEGEAFGEMALLDPGPRSVTVTASSPLRLLRLSRGPFLDIVHERPEVAVGIMEVLVRRLRSRVSDLAAQERPAEGPSAAGTTEGHAARSASS